MRENESFFKIIGDREQVLAFSKCRIPFEVKKAGNGAEISAFRTALRTALSCLSLKQNEMLCGKYGTTDPTKQYYDLENVLFYNVGNKPIYGQTGNGLAFSVIGDAELDDLRREYGVPPEFCHCYLYSLRKQNNTPSTKGFVLARWKPFPCEKLNGKHAADFWKLFKSVENTGIYSRFSDENLTGTSDFSLFLTITKPTDTFFRVESVMKPLLDGLICSLHGREKDMTAFAEKIHCDPAWFQTEGILGKRDFLQNYPNGLKWNPADERCKKALIRVREGNAWTFSGEVRPLCPYCRSASAAKIFYGMPAYSEELETAEAYGELFFGGCCVAKNGAAFRCNRCKKRF